MSIFFYKAIFSILTSFSISYYLIPILIILARKFKLIDEPNGTIKKQKEATPYLGGVGVFVGFLCSICLVLPFEGNLLFFFIGCTLLLCVGLIDDLLVLRPYQKFFGQFLATICFLKAGFYMKATYFSHVWNIFVSIFWLLLVINAFNLVDVMDGLATVLAFCATSSFLIIAYQLRQYDIVLLLAAFLGSLIAFFWYNKPAARIYLGDAGSLFIGGFLAGIPFFFNWGLHNNFGYFTPVIILAIPLLEVAALIIIRTYKGIPFYYGSPDHFSIYLQNKGWSKEFILVYVAILSTFLGFCAFLFMINVLSLVPILVLGGLFLTGWLRVLLSKKSVF